MGQVWLSANVLGGMHFHRHSNRTRPSRRAVVRPASVWTYNVRRAHRQTRDRKRSQGPYPRTVGMADRFGIQEGGEMNQSELIAVIARCRATKAEYAPLLDALKQEEEAASAELIAWMAENNTERVSGSGISVTRVVKRIPWISDQNQLHKYLDDQGTLGRCMSIDVKAALAQHGDKAPGISYTESAYPMVKVKS